MAVFRSAQEAVDAGRGDTGGIQRASQRGSQQHDAFMNALRARQQQAVSSVGPGGAAPVNGDLQGYAQQRLAQLGFSDPREWDALYRLWQKESGWNPNAVNKSSGAFGIAQILPSAHPTANRNMSAQEQIEWGLNYIRNRYGSPSKAWAHSQRTNWY